MSDSRGPASPSLRRPEKGRDIKVVCTSVHGVTTSHPAAFDHSQKYNLFVTCAGSAVVLHRLDASGKGSTQQVIQPPVSSTVKQESICSPGTPPRLARHGANGSPKTPLKSEACSSSPLRYRSQELPQRLKRPKEISCVSLSSCGKFLALGEVGRHPRLILYRIEEDGRSPKLIASSNEHTEGIQALSFSSDTKFLCSLGTQHDGFVFLFALDTANTSLRLIASNKCTTAINTLWLDHSIVSFGQRHVKLWLLGEKEDHQAFSSSPSIRDKKVILRAPTTLTGRNCILGSMADAYFTCGTVIRDQMAVLCTSGGDICIAERCKAGIGLKKICNITSHINCISFCDQSNSIFVATKSAANYKLPVSELVEVCSTSSNEHRLQRFQRVNPSEYGIIACGYVSDMQVVVFANAMIGLERSPLHGDAADSSQHLPSFELLPCHAGPIIGLQSLGQNHASGADEYLTASANGHVIFWTVGSHSQRQFRISLDPFVSNTERSDVELQCVLWSEFANILYIGDSCGYLRAVDCEGSCLAHIKAHEAEIRGIAAYADNDTSLVVSCSRDKNLQVYQYVDTGFNLLQTLNEHSGAVLDARLLSSGQTLASISMDHSLIIRTLITRNNGLPAFISIHILKTTSIPLAFTPDAHSPNILLVSMSDKRVMKYDYGKGKPIDETNAKSAILSEMGPLSLIESSALNKINAQTGLILGVMRENQAICLLNRNLELVVSLQAQKTISKADLLHTDETEGKIYVISCGRDGTIMLFSVSITSAPAYNNENHPSKGTKTNVINVHQKPPQRVLTASEVLHIKKRTPELFSRLSPDKRT